MGNNEHLSKSQSIGDFNGDGYEDTLVFGDEAAYVLLGPVKLDDIDDVSSRSEIRIELRFVGRDVFLVETYAPGNGGEVKIQSYRFTRSS